MNQTSKRVVEALSKLNEASKEVQAALLSCMEELNTL